MNPPAIDRELERLVRSELARGIKPRSVRRLRQTVTEFQSFLTTTRSKDDLREATSDDVVAYLAWLEEDQRLNPITVSLRLYRLRKVTRFLHGAGCLLRDPTARLKRRHAPRKPRVWLTEPEVTALLERPDTNQAIGVRDRAVMELLYSSGLRLGELCALELEDVDLGEGLVVVRTSKTGRGRMVPVGDVALQWIGRYLKEARGQHRRPRSPHSLFLGEKGGRLSEGQTRRFIPAYAKAAGIAKRVTPYVLRHSLAVHLLRHGASTRHIQEMLGHRHLISTQVYTQLVPEELKRVHRRAHPRERQRRVRWPR